MEKLPKITIVIVTLNNERTIEKCAQSIVSQDYPKKLVEYLNIDGGSKDSTKTILRRFGFKIIESFIKADAEAQRAIGLADAKNNLIVSIDADNYLPTNKWLRQMIRPFISDPIIIQASTLHYTYRENESLGNRYAALFGTPDPVVYYVGRPDRLPQNVKKWTLGKIIKETPNYYIVEFTKETLPTVGCNGVIYKKDILLKYGRSAPGQFLHIDVFADLLENGYNRFAIVKNDIVHDTASSLGLLIKKRMAFLSNYYLKTSVKRKYLIFNPRKLQDMVKLLLFVVYTFTFVKPLIDALRGYFVIKDRAWFLHPIMCLIYLYSYGVAILERFFVKKI